MEFSDVFSFSVGAGGSSALLLFFVKRWIDRMDDRLDTVTKMLMDIEISLARKEGESEGQNKLIWSELDKQQNDITRLNAVISQHEKRLANLKLAKEIKL